MIAPDSALPLIVQETGTRVSPHTARDLRTARVTVRVAPQDAERLSVLLREGQQAGGEVVDKSGGHWHVGTYQETYSDIRGAHTFTAELYEVEQLRPEHVEIGDLVLQPSKYLEQADGEGITIELRAPLSEADEAAFRELYRTADTRPEYMAVVRVGVEDRPRSMRFGKIFWHRRDGRADVSITLVEDICDQGVKPFIGFAEPELTHALIWGATVQAQFDALLDELRAVGVLDAAVEARIRAAGEGAYARRRWDAHQVADLDVWE